MPPAKQVILFVIDGLRPDALQQAYTPQIDNLVAQGTHTGRAQTVTPSVSLPCHTSLFFAVPPARHGVLSNVWVPLQPPVPSLIEVVHQAGLGTAAFYTWEELRDLDSPGALDFAYYHRLGDPEGDLDLEIGAVAATYIVQQRPAFAFVYLGATDEVGHRHGWMSVPYLQAVNKADRAIGLVLEALRDEVVQLVQQRLVPPQPEAVEETEPSEEEAIPRIEPPKTGVEIVDSVERKGTLYHTVKDLRNGNVVQNVTRSSARKLWRYAITQQEQTPVNSKKITWHGDIGFWKTYKRGGKVRYNLAQRDPDGKIHIYYGVTEEGFHGEWRRFLEGE